jgi:twitching motility protein PilI
MANLHLQTDPFSLLRDIAERSRKHAFGLPQQEAARDLWHGVAFVLGGVHLVMSLEHVREILKYPALSPVPGAKPWVKGIANIRGTLLPIMDLNGFLSGERAALDRRTRVLVVESAGVTCGLIVDEVLGMRHFLADSYNSGGPDASPALDTYVSGSYGQGGYLWGVFDPERLMETPEFIQVAA